MQRPLTPSSPLGLRQLLGLYEDSGTSAARHWPRLDGNHHNSHGDSRGLSWIIMDDLRDILNQHLLRIIIIIMDCETDSQNQLGILKSKPAILLESRRRAVENGNPVFACCTCLVYRPLTASKHWQKTGPRFPSISSYSPLNHL